MFDYFIPAESETALSSRRMKKRYNLFNSSFSSICKICEMTASGQAVRAFLLYRNSLAFNSEDYNNISEIIREICEE